jgi:hypothetical protein
MVGLLALEEVQEGAPLPRHSDDQPGADGGAGGPPGIAPLYPQPGVPQEHLEAGGRGAGFPGDGLHQAGDQLVRTALGASGRPAAGAGQLLIVAMLVAVTGWRFTRPASASVAV